jgi:hypothetical protein
VLQRWPYTKRTPRRASLLYSGRRSISAVAGPISLMEGLPLSKSSSRCSPSTIGPTSHLASAFSLWLRAISRKS